MEALFHGLRLQLSDQLSCKRLAIWPLSGVQICILRTYMVQSCPFEELQTDNPCVMQAQHYLPGVRRHP